MKRYLPVLITIFILLSGLTISAAAAEEITGPELVISASAAEVRPGDEVTFTLTMGAVNDLQDFQIRIMLPDGLTFAGGELAEGLQDKMKYDTLEWSNATMDISGTGGNYTSKEETDLASFRCTVDGSYLGTVSVTVSVPEMYCGSSDDGRPYEVTYTTTVIPAEIEIVDNNNIPTGENITLYPDTSRTIYVTSEENTGDISYTFTSSDPGIVTVTEDGTVTALAEGTASVTAVGSDGSETVYNITVPHQHTFGEWEIITEATETGPGLQTRTCTVCGSTEAQVIPQLEAAGNEDEQSDSDTGSGGFLHSPWLEIVIVAAIVVVVVIILLIYTRCKNRKS